MHLVLPRKTKAFSIAKIRYLETATFAEKEVFRLEVTVCDTHFMEVANPPHELLKKTVGLSLF